MGTMPALPKVGPQLPEEDVALSDFRHASTVGLTNGQVSTWEKLPCSALKVFKRDVWQFLVAVAASGQADDTL